MAMSHAIRFLNEIDHLRDLRNVLFECNGLDDVFQSLREAGYAFTHGEFEEAVSHVRTACPDHESLTRLMDKVRMMRLVFTYV